MTNFVICVASCKKYINSRVPFIEKYCLQGADYRVFTGPCDIKNSTHLVLDCDDDYFALREKTILIFRWFMTTSYDFIVKCDDDTFIDYSELKRLNVVQYGGHTSSFSDVIRNKRHHLEYIYKITNRHQDLQYFDDISFDFKYCEGGCYILNRKSVADIVQYIDHHTIPSIIQEDITVGYVAHILNIPVTDFSVDIQWYDNTPFSLHPCKPVLFPILAAKLHFAERQEVLKKLVSQNIHYCKYFNLDTATINNNI